MLEQLIEPFFHGLFPSIKIKIEIVNEAHIENQSQRQL